MDLQTIKRRLLDSDNDGLWLRERLMPRWMDGSPARPVSPFPDTDSPRLAAVLVLLYEHAGEICLPLTVRTAALRNHSGEVSLPGGSYDEADGDLSQTALREAWEELGIVREHVELWTALTPVWIPVSNFQITPFVGWSHQRPDFAAAEAEVAELIEVPLRVLLEPDVVRSETGERRGQMMYIPYFAVDTHKVWGATALVLAEVVGKLTKM